MAERKIVVDIALQTADAANSLKDVKKSLKELKDIQLEFGEGTEEFTKASEKAGELKDRLNAVNDSLKNLSNSPVENVRNSFGTLSSQIRNLDFSGAKQSLKDLGASSGTLVKSVLGIGPGVKTATIAFRGLGAAIAATGIGALAIAIGVIIKNFDKIKESGGALGDVFNFIGDTVEKVERTFLELLDTFGLIDLAAMDAADNQIKANEEVEKSLDKLNKSYDANSDKYSELTNRKFKADLDYKAKVLEINKDETLSDKEKQDLIVQYYEQRNRKIQAVDDERAKAVIEANKKENERLQKLEDERLKNLEKLANKRAETDLNATLQLQKNLDTQNEIQENYFKTVDEVDALYSEISKDRRFKTSEEIYAEINKRLQAEQDAAFKKAELDVITTEQLKTNNQLQVDIQTEFKQSQQEVDDLYSQIAQEGRLKTSEEIYAEIAKRLKAQEDANKKEAEDAEKLRQLKTQAVKNGFTTIANLAELFAGQSKKSQERAFKVQQAANIANATIDTYTSAVAAYKSLAGIPIVGPVLGAVASAAAITAGLLNIKKIKEQKFDSGGGGAGGGSSTPPNLSGGNLPTPSQPTPNQPTPSPQLLGFGDTGQNNLGTPTSVVRAVVLESDITNAQIRVKNYQTESELGG